MTDKNINNSFNKDETVYQTELTLKLQVPLHIEDLRRLVHLWDAEMCGSTEDAIAPENVSAYDFISMWVAGEYQGDALIIEDEWRILT